MRINDGAKEHKLQNSPDNIQVQLGTVPVQPGTTSSDLMVRM